MKAATLSVATSYVMYGFQSTPPVKAATVPDSQHFAAKTISIHAAREGGDESGVRVLPLLKNFNPRRP